MKGVSNMSRVTLYNRRLRPFITDTDYYMLTSLRISMEKAIDKYLSGRSNLSIFDYGCGDVPYKELFSAFLSSYIAGDLQGNPCADMILEPSGRVPCTGETFDVVLSIQVLEHVPDFNVYLSEAKRILKPNGFLFLSTHGWWTHHPYPHDYWRWTREGLQKVVTDNGFSIVTLDWMIGMLAYSCQLRLQCWKGLLENKGRLAVAFLHIISFVYQEFMRIGDKVTPDQIGRDNAAIYFLVAQRL